VQSVIADKNVVAWRRKGKVGAKVVDLGVTEKDAAGTLEQ
jgi:hypothetical protein